MILYYITDRKQFPGIHTEQLHALLSRITAAAKAGVDYIQLREKDLSARELESLARQALQGVRDHGANTRLLINSRVDVALAVGADGVHLTSTDISAADARSIWAASVAQTRPSTPVPWKVAVSCHSPADVRLAESHGADFVVLAPIFEKARTTVPPLGLAALRQATRVGEPLDRRVEAGDQRSTIPVLALGGITIENAAECMRVGAAGIAGIRIFQEGDITETAGALREWSSRPL
ncbi:MAG: thiamine phosphate synthase [Terriglobia bacterium]|jgi:thiamine-phosphate pyrophosphorylase|nr:thiamine phosphate synthase [Terriglobia bacterium]